MVETPSRAEHFERYQRRRMIALLLVALLLGGIGLSLALSPPGAVAKMSNLPWWLLPIVIAVFVSLFTSAGQRRFPADSPEVKTAMQDEWRRTNLLRASRIALIVVLIGQWPLGLAIGFLTHPQLTPARVASAMAAATITLGVTTTVLVFLFFDRE